MSAANKWKENAEAVRARNDVEAQAIAVREAVDRLTGVVRNSPKNMARTLKALEQAHRIIADQAEVEDRD